MSAYCNKSCIMLFMVLPLQRKVMLSQLCVPDVNNSMRKLHQLSTMYCAI